MILPFVGCGQSTLLRLCTVLDYSVGFDSNSDISIDGPEGQSD